MIRAPLRQTPLNTKSTSPSECYRWYESRAWRRGDLILWVWVCGSRFCDLISWVWVLCFDFSGVIWFCDLVGSWVSDRCGLRRWGEIGVSHQLRVQHGSLSWSVWVFDRCGGRWNCGLVVIVIGVGLGCRFVIWNSGWLGIGWGFVIWNCDWRVVLF